MVITTYDLLNYLRCRRFAALDRNNTKRKQKTQHSSHLAELTYLSVENNYHFIGFEQEDSDIGNPKALHKDQTDFAIQQMKDLITQSFQDRYHHVEIRTNHPVKRSFHQGHILEAKVDIEVIKEEEHWYFTMLPMTDKELIDIQFTVNKKKWPLFFQDADGFYRMHTITKADQVVSNYDEKIAKLMDRHQDMGRHVYDIAFQSFLLKNQPSHSKSRFFLVTLNKDYTFDGRMHQNRPVYSFDLLRIFDCTNLTTSMTSLIEADLYRMLNLIELNDDSPCPLVKQECMRAQPFECPFVEYCFSHIPSKNAIYHYFNHHLGFKEGMQKSDPWHDTYDLINEGMVDMLDVPIQWLQREKNLMQRYCVENNIPYINKRKVKALLDTVIYPLYYLDFEAYPSMLPRFSGEKPYTQSVFQFSIHKETIDHRPTLHDPEFHVEFLASPDGDQRVAFIEALLQAIPEGKSSIIVYNKTFEKNRIFELASLYPQYKTRLLEIESRMFDLLKVLKNDYAFYLSQGFSKAESETFNYYHPDLSGSYSLKKVYPLFGNYSYEELPINNGLCAYLNYALLPQYQGELYDQTIDALKRYCQMDTYAMVEILHGLLSLVE